MGSITAKRLGERMGSFVSVLQASEDDLRSVPGIGPERARRFAEAFRSISPDEELERARQLHVTLITWADKTYPALLRQIEDPPMALYLRGNAEILSQPAVALIGTRHPTVYGRETARKLGYQLASAGYTVISGLAAGIDAESHKGALQAHGKTAGILGGALNRFFPKENEPLAQAMVKGGGCVVSEFPFGRAPDRTTFPMRNRVVSGLCKGIVVVECPQSSGTLITVGQALEQNRTVMAVPGRIDSPASQGCHKLLRDGARLVTCADDVIEELQDLFSAQRMARQSKRPETGDPAPQKPAPVLSEEERKIYELLSTEGDSIDSVVRASGIQTGKASSILISLQVKRLAKALPGGRIAKLT